jgi:tetratricopeptide (TPR) repeat protein/DNA-binding SARP family transcriptional activator
VEFCVLGEVEVRFAATPIPIRGARRQSLLAVLLLEANRPVTSDQLIDRVWGTARRPARPANALQTQLTLLRRALTPVQDISIEWQPATGYRLTIDEDNVDVHRFGRLVDQVRGADADQAAALLTDALALWRGNPFEGLDTPWLSAVRTTLTRQHLAARLHLADLRLASGEHAALLPSLTDLADEHPLDEHLAGQLMLALYRCGRASDALAHFQLIRHRLSEELGTDPIASLRELHQRILTSDPGLDRSGTVAVGTTTPVPRQLPSAPGSFTGREPELTALTTAVDTSSGAVVISALVGTGGIGKTWLALHWAHQNLHRFPDGQLFVDLRGFSPEGQPLPAGAAVRGFLDAFGVDQARIPAEPHAQAALLRSLVADKRMLILLDNAADTAQVIPILPGSATCTVLVTSRRAELTGLIVSHGARHLPIDVLSDTESRALLAGRLGTDRVAAEPEAVAELVVSCAGFPLALSIVAGRAHTRPDLPLATLAAELREAGLAALDGDDPAASLPAVLSWSYRTLSPRQARVFGLLGNAPGHDIGLPAAAGLTGFSTAETRVLLRSLERASLLHQDITGRYRMHDLVRRYAAGHAQPDHHAALTRLITYYVGAATDATNMAYPQDKLPGHHTPAASVAWLDSERPNLVAVTGYTATQGWPHEAIRLASTLYRYLNARAHHNDAFTVHQHALHAAAEAHDRTAEAAALNNLGNVHFRWGNYDMAFKHHQQALALHRDIGDHAGEANTLNNLGLVYWRWGRYHEALDQYQSSLSLAVSTGDRVAEANALDIVGLVHKEWGQCEQACGYHLRALVIHREIGNRTGEANSLDNLGHAYRRSGAYTQAIAYHEQALKAYRQIGNRTGEADALDGLGTAHLRSSRLGEAQGFLQRAMAIYHELGNRTGEASARNGLGETCCAASRLQDAITHHEAALTLAVDVGVRHEEARAFDGLATARQTLGDNTGAHRQWQEALALYTDLGVPEADTIRTKLSRYASTTSFGLRPRSDNS